MSFSTQCATPILELATNKDVAPLIECLKKLTNAEQLKELSHQVDKDGNSFLHLVVLHHSIEDIKTFLSILDDDAIIEMQLVTNNNGLTAMQLAESLSPDQKSAIHQLLLPTAIKASMRYINDDKNPLVYNNVLKQFNIKPGTRLAENLKRGCEAVNACKSAALKSSTHPRTNTLSSHDVNEIDKKIHQIRKSLYQQRTVTLDEYIKTIKNERYGNCGEAAFLSANFLYSKRQNKKYELIRLNDTYLFVAMNLHNSAVLDTPYTWGSDAQLIYAGKYPNMSESSFFLSNQLQPSIYITDSNSLSSFSNLDNIDNIKTAFLIDCGKLNVAYSIETAQFRNGDHVFCILDRNLESNINKPSSYGENAVVIDGWSGNVFPANQINKNLMDYYNISINGKTYNLLCHFNSNYHCITTKNTFNAPILSLTMTDPDVISKENTERIKKKLAATQSNKVAIDNSSNATETTANVINKLTKKSTKPCLVVEDINGGFNSFEDLVHLLDETLALKNELENKVATKSNLLFFTPKPSSIAKNTTLEEQLKKTY